MDTPSLDGDLTPGLALLRDLAATGGWVFLPRHDPAGDLDDVVGVRVRHDYTDAIRVRSDTDAAALRMVNANGADPGGTVWSTDGTLLDVAQALLLLPEPGQPGAPSLVIGAAPKLWVTPPTVR